MNLYDQTLTIHPNTIILSRRYFVDATMGEFIFPDGIRIDTIELPWRDNFQRVSCIPEGTYTLRKRVSGVVKRSTGGKYIEGWEVTKVPNRTYIMIHPGNTVDDFLGCIGPGMNDGYLSGKRAVLSSRKAFDILMRKMEKFDEWELIVLEAANATT